MRGKRSSCSDDTPPPGILTLHFRTNNYYLTTSLNIVQHRFRSMSKLSRTIDYCERLQSKLAPIHHSVISGAGLACGGHWAYCAPSDPGRAPIMVQHWHTGLSTPAVSLLWVHSSASEALIKNLLPRSLCSKKVGHF